MVDINVVDNTKYNSDIGIQVFVFLKEKRRGKGRKGFIGYPYFLILIDVWTGDW